MEQASVLEEEEEKESVKMAVWNVGSVGSVVLNLIDDIPTSISGLLPVLVEQEIAYAESYTGQTIGTTAIAAQYQPAITSLTASAVLKALEIQGADVSNISLGEFSIGKGKGSPAESMSEAYRLDGEKKLNELGRSINFYKALG